MTERLELSDTSAGMFAAMMRGERTWGMFQGRYDDDEGRWYYWFTEKGAEVAASVGLDARTELGLYLFTLLLLMADPFLRGEKVHHQAVAAQEWFDREIKVPLPDAIAIVGKALAE